MKLPEHVINKDYILKHVSQVKIFSVYTGIKESDIEYAITTGNCISSTIRRLVGATIDKRPSLGFRYKGTKLKARDFAGYFWGDCFDLVALLLDKDVNNKQHFIEILQHILTSVETGVELSPLLTAIQNQRDIIEISVRNWSNQDDHYWSKFNISREILTKYYVYPIDSYWINRHSQPECKYRYTKTDPCYAYYFGKDNNGIDLFQLYFPFRTKDSLYSKFITNYSNIRGVLQLDYDADILILTKSYKDVLSIASLSSFTLQGGIKLTAIAPNSESDILTYEQIRWFQDRFVNIVSLYDFDKTGIRGACRLRRDYGVEPIFFTNGKYKTIDYNVKDFSECVDKYGIMATIDLVNNVVETNKNRIR